jgi:hypothetical protein
VCSNYLPARSEHIRKYFGVEPLAFSFQPEAYPGYLAPLIRFAEYDQSKGAPDRDEMECIPACFGLVPASVDLKLALLRIV